MSQGKLRPNEKCKSCQQQNGVLQKQNHKFQAMDTGKDEHQNGKVAGVVARVERNKQSMHDNITNDKQKVHTLCPCFCSVVKIIGCGFQGGRVAIPKNAGTRSSGCSQFMGGV